MNKSFNFIDLFAGIGGFHIAMHKNGGNCVLASEWDKHARLTYEHNFAKISPDVFASGNFKSDITKVIPADIPDFDVLCAGFPCQAFSVAGLRQGFADSRGTLFFNIEEIISVKRPKAFMLENVKNLQSHDGGKTFRIMLQILQEKLGYRVYYKVMNSMEYANVPQNRERIFIVGFDPDQVSASDSFEFPAPVKLKKTVRDVIFPEKQADDFYYKNTHQYYPALKSELRSRETVYQWRRVYIRENKSNVCPTLTANMGGGGHNVPLIVDDFGIRKLTPQECLLFQGYPRSFKFPASMANSHRYKQAGNSVVVPLVERIAKNLASTISND